MGRRSSFPRRAHDDYDTPEKAVLPLLPMLGGLRSFAEPCCGNGHLVKHLEAHGMPCAYQGDIRYGQDALTTTHYGLADVIITNPPWSRPALHALINHFIAIKLPAWLLFDFGWAASRQAAPMLVHCQQVLPIGRISWFANGVDAKDDCAWFLFDGRHRWAGPVLVPRRS